MSEILLYYKRPDPTTWVYMSSFLTIGLFFVFHRFWSIRNLDIVLLILLAPGLLMVHEGRRRQLVLSEASALRLQQQRIGQRLDPPSRLESGRLETFEPLSHLFPVFALVPNQNADPQGEVPSESEQAGGTESSARDESLAEAVPDAAAREDGPSDAAPEVSDRANTSEELPASDVLTASDELRGEGGDGELDDAEGSEAETDDTTRDLEADFEGEVIDGGYAPIALQRWGFIYLFVVEALILLRLMLDPLMVRRPLLDPNLTTGGLNFIGISLFIFMMANVVTSSPRVQVEQGPELGPGYALMNMLPAIPTRPVSDQPGGAVPPTISELTDQQLRLTQIARALAILAQLAIVSGIVLISNRHFGNLRAGVGCATLYLLLPYTAQMTGRVDHALPAALLLWAVLTYRRPFVAGMFLGLAGGLVYYPLFLLPLWSSFYWQRGVRKFAMGVLAMLAVLMIALSFDNLASLGDHLQRMFGLLNPNREPHEFRGIWALGWNPVWRLPVIVAFVILSAFFAIWPTPKNLGNLISGSAALMAAAQFWHGYGGGLYIAWFLPLLLLTIFRPNLQDRIATKVVTGGPSTVRGARAELESI